MSKDSAVDMKDVELNELDPEKQPMTAGEVGSGGTEKNGCVKVKVPEEADIKFTGLSKEELMKVAGTPGWVRTRWVLLVLFWLGWLGMLAGAIAIIIQAPRCKPLPKMEWWNEGIIYQVWDVDAYSGAAGMTGLEEKLDSLSQLKVKGLVLGPFHTVQADQPETVDFKSMAPEMGTEQQFENFVRKAHKKGISVVLDVTPNYSGKEPWFSADVAGTAEKLKEAIPYWIQVGVDGIQVAGLEQVVSEAPEMWANLKDVVQANRTEGEQSRALIGMTEKTSAVDVAALLEDSGVDLLLSGVLKPGQAGSVRAQAIQQLYNSHNQTSLGWSLGSRTEGHLASLVGSKLVRLYQLLLFTLPGTPVFSYGDEIGLVGQNNTPYPKMLWDPAEPVEEKNETLKSEREQRLSCRSFFKTLSDLRGKERSLLHGDFLLLHNDTTSLAFVRQWDQSERYMAAVNWGAEPVTLRLVSSDLPDEATVKLSTDPDKLAPESSVSLKKLDLGGQQGVLLQFPFVA